MVKYQNRLYALHAHQDEEDSPNVVTGTLRVFHLDFYALLDPWFILYFGTPTIEVNFGVNPKTLSKLFLESTLVGDQLYLDEHTKISLAQFL